MYNFLQSSAICRVAGVGKARVTAKIAKPPSFVDINQGKTGWALPW